MRSFFAYTASALGVVILLAGCSHQSGGEATANGNGNGHADAAKIVLVAPGPDAQEKAQEALIMAEPGMILEFAEGTFEFTQSLSLEDVEGVTIRGQGPDKTILNFAKLVPGSGGEGIIAKSNGFTIESLAIEDTRADGIKTEGITGVTFRNLHIRWTRGPHEDNGAYGVYPVLCKDVLVEDCYVTDCADAGIYVGQSENVIVRRNKVERNVAGIEIENTIGADVYDNECTDNTGGLMVFSLPDLELKNGRQCRLFNNHVYANNHRNFAKEGNIVATIPPGTGVMIMANDDVHVFENTIEGNDTANVSIISYHATGREIKDAEYDPYPEGIYIYDNRIANGGQNPSGTIGDIIRALLGSETSDILYDGIVNPERLVDGELPAQYGVFIRNNGDATFVNLDLGTALAGGETEPQISRDLAPHDGELPPLPAIVVPGVD